MSELSTGTGIVGSVISTIWAWLSSAPDAVRIAFFSPLVLLVASLFFSVYSRRNSRL